MHARRLNRLLIGPPSPTSVVGVFHGLGGSLQELKPMAQRWSHALPSTGFLLLEAPDRDYHHRVLLSGTFSGDWYRFPHLRSEFGTDETAYSSMVTRCISGRCEQVSAELDEHLASVGLANDRLILAGFSQGAAISAYTGLQRHCRGVLALGGPCPPRAPLLPANDVTQVCVVVGSEDHCVAHAELTGAFAKYAVRDLATDGVHVIRGQGHVVSKTSESIGLAFLRSCGCT